MPLDGPYARAKARMYAHKARRQLANPANSLLTVLVLAGIWGALYSMWRTGFYYMTLMPWLELLFYPSLFAVFFLVVFLLMTVTSLVLHSQGLYGGGEAELVLHMPIAPARAALYRSAELCLVNSLGALLLITPLVVAAATVPPQPGYPPVTAMRGAWLLLILLPPFLVIPSTLGAVAAIALRRLAGRRSMYGIAGGATLAGVALLGHISGGVDMRMLGSGLPPGRLVRLVSEALGPAHASVLPSHWLVEALFGPARGTPQVTLWYTAVLLVGAAACLLLWVATIRAWYYAGWLAANVTDSTTAAAGARPNRMRQWDRALGSLPGHARALMLKDTLLFTRDRVMRTQGLILLGPVLVYFLALRALYASLGEDPWYTLLISATNVAALGVIVCAFGCRFLMPLVGIERLKFWLLRMAPPRLSTLLLQKWLFGSLVLLGISQPLLALSNYMTAMDPLFVRTSHLGLLVLAPVVSAICIGMGALFPDLAADSGSRALNGMAATAALVLSFACVALLLGGVAAAYGRFLYRGDFDLDLTAQWPWLSDPAFLRLLWRNFFAGGAAGVLLGMTLLILGHGRLRRLEIP